MNDADPSVRLAVAFERLAAAAELIALCYAAESGEDAVSPGDLYAAAREVRRNANGGIDP